MSAVQGNIERVCGEAVIGEIVVQRTLAIAAVAIRINSDNRSPIGRFIARPVVDAESGHNLDVLGRVAANLGEVLELFGFESERLLASVYRSNREILHAGDFNCLSASANRKRYVHIALLAAAQSNGIFFMGLEAASLDR